MWFSYDVVMQSTYHLNSLNVFFLMAGILAIAKPCSVIVDVKELYGSESKSQVYAHLHELLSKDEMTDIGKQVYKLLVVDF